MTIVKKVFLLSFVLFLFIGNEIKSNVIRKDTLEYRVFVAADKIGVNHFGGLTTYREKLNVLFDQVNDYWNNGSDDLKYYFRYVPDLQLVYEGSSQVVEDFYNKNFFSKMHDVVLIIDSKLDYDNESGGWYCGTANNHISIIACKGRSKTEFEDIFDKGYRGIAHELGHYRGVTDLYADRVFKDKNPITKQQLEPDSCIMNNHYVTNHWSSYAVNIINHTALSTRPSKDFPNFFRQMFPESISVTLKGKAKNKKGVKFRLYGSRARYNDIIETPYREFESDKNGNLLISGVPALYDQPEAPIYTEDLPWNRWFTFLLEAEYKGEKKYVWLPEYEVQNVFFKNQSVFPVEIWF